MVTKEHPLGSKLTSVVWWVLLVTKVLIVQPLWVIASMMEVVQAAGQDAWPFRRYAYKIVLDILVPAVITAAMIMGFVCWLALGIVAWWVAVLGLIIYMLAGLVFVWLVSIDD